MKKKIINGFLMVALIAATSASFVSCKDNDEDMKYDLLNALKGDITTVTTDVNQAKSDAAKAISDAAAAATAANKAQAAADAAQGTADEAKSTAQQALDKINALDLSGYMKKDEFNDSVSKYLKDWALESTVAERFSAVWDELNAQKEKIAKANERIDSLATVTSNIEDDVDAIKTDLENVKKDVKKAKEDITSIIKTLENLITSVTVNATSTSLLANSMVLPGVNAQLLGAPFGIVKVNTTFPVADAVLTDAEIDKTVEIKKGYTNSEAGNAGTVYFTVNPSNIDASLVNLSLVNSKGEKKYVELGEITPATDKELVWGGLSTRADGDATLWQAPATIDFENTPEVTLSKIIDFKSIASDVKTMINDAKKVEATKASVKSTSRTLISDAAQLVASLTKVTIPELPALALKAQWKDTVGTRSVISDYSIAATAYKPFAFNALNGVDLGGDVDLTKVDNFFKKIVDKITNQINSIDLSKVKIDTIKIDNYSGYNKSAYVWINVDKLYESDATIGEYVKDVVISLQVTYEDKTPFAYGVGETTKTIDGKKHIFTVQRVAIDADMSKDIKNMVTQVNKSLKSTGDGIEDVISQVKNIIKKADDAATKAKDLENRATDYLQKYINKTINFIASGRILEPILLVNAKDGIHRVTGTYEAGTYTFLPTTMNYELLAPAYKKYVALVKNGKVVEGQSYLTTNGGENFKSVKLNLTEKGDYTIVYSAIDFNGNQISKKYNVTVK